MADNALLSFLGSIPVDETVSGLSAMDRERFYNDPNVNTLSSLELMSLVPQAIDYWLPKLKEVVGSKDKILSGQMPKIKDLAIDKYGNDWNYETLALSGALGEHPRTKSYSPTGEELYNDISAILGDIQKDSEYLRSIGIPGHRYLDQGSREAGKGTHNYVTSFTIRMPSTFWR